MALSSYDTVPYFQLKSGLGFASHSIPSSASFPQKAAGSTYIALKRILALALIRYPMPSCPQGSSRLLIRDAAMVVGPVRRYSTSTLNRPAEKVDFAIPPSPPLLHT